MRNLIIASLIFVLAMALAGCAAAPAPAPLESTVHLQQEKEPGSITVTGRVGLEVTPDVAQVSIGVSSQAATPGSVREQNSAAINATLEALAELGIEEKDIQTTNMNLGNRYDNNGNVIGYRMTTDLTVYVREIDKAGEVVDAVIAAGSNELNGVDYLVSNRDEVYNQALIDAIEMARQKAEAMAAASGKTLGEVQKVEETSRAVATVREYSNADTGGPDLMNARAKTTIRPGSTQIEAAVQVVFLTQ